MAASDQDQSGAVPTVAVSWGELIDKMTILDIKSRRLTAPPALANVRKELAVLRQALERLSPHPPALDDLTRQMTAVNEELWEIEDKIRAKEARKTFDAEFVSLARAVYLTNDRRSALKREINLLLKSTLVEEKQYTPYA
jgi:predicted  nucleic acid-binding Zn-ribbon protein